MSTVDKLTALFRAISMKDWSSVETAAKAIVAHQDDKGHHAAARTLRGALVSNGVSRLQPVNGESPLVAGAVSALLPLREQIDLADVRLRPKARDELQKVISEWQHRDRLLACNLEARHRLLFYGPPGCGKSMTASALGTALGLPVYVVRFDAIITSYLGQTAVNLRQLFQFAERDPCVLLIDELDALGRRRGDRMDVGELDRIVIALMQALEHSHPTGLIIATCNLPDELDRALWRLFDVSIEFPLPTKAELSSFARSRAANLNLRWTQSLRRHFEKRISYADAETFLAAEARTAALKGL